MSRRWIPWHILCLVLMIAFLRMAQWQWSVASAPHPPGASVQPWRNYAYAVNWVIFTGFVGWFWWRFMSDQRKVDAEQAELEAAEAASVAAEQAQADADGVVEER